MELLHDRLPDDNVLIVIASMYKVKMFLKVFDLKYEKIHARVKDCCLFRKDKQYLENCPKCRLLRWKVDERTRNLKSDILAKNLRYFPIIPMFKRMFSCLVLLKI